MIQSEITIGMNGSMLDEQPTGVGIYSFNLINTLSYLYRNERYRKLTVFTPTRSHLNKNLNIIKLPGLLQSSKYGKLAAFSRFVWNAFYYPFVAGQFNLLISPTTHGSFFLNNQVITIHDLLSLRYKNISPHQRFYFKYLLPFLISKAKLVIAVSETTKQDIIRFLKCPEQKIHVIYNGYDHSRYCLTENGEQIIYKEYGVRNYLLAVGPTYPHKNFDLLINAYNELDDSFKKQYPLVIAGGKGSYLELLKDLVKKLNLEKKVHFLGYVPIRLMPQLYREAFALVFPSLYEGFGLPLLEAMACGCPVVASNTSSMPEVCGEAAIYFDPADKQTLISSLEKLFSDKIVRNELREKGLIQSKKFSWEQTARTLKILIDKQFHLTHFKN